MDENFIQNLEYDIDRKEDNDMSKVTNVTIKNVRMNDIVERLYSHLDPRNNLRDPVINMTFQSLPTEIRKKIGTSMLIFRYCIHRVLTHYGIYLDKNWNSYVVDDYYSQEVSDIRLKPELATTINEFLQSISKLSDDKKIEAVLKLEHGRLIPIATGKHWIIKEINSDHLVFTNKALLVRCIEEAKTSSYLKGYNLPRGLCYKVSDTEYRVIDGYHRLAPVASGSRVLVIHC